MNLAQALTYRVTIARRLSAVLAIVALLQTSAPACNVPVFRYALERWAADRYEAVIFHQGVLGEALLERIAVLNKSEDDGDPVNLDVTVANLDDPLEADLADLWSTHKSETAEGIAWLVVRGPRIGGRPTIVWSGPLEEFDPEEIVDSPARQELVGRLLSGDSAVWLVFAGEDDPAAEEAFELLSEELERLGDELPLPGGIGLPGSEVYSPIPLTLRFSALRVDVNDPAERWFVESLRTAAQFTEEDGPLVVPVFGRGRALEVIPAGEVDAGLVEDISRFLTGACSCQVKEQNPGVDLLLSVDWIHRLFEEDFLPPPPALFDGETSDVPTLVVIPSGLVDDEPSVNPSRVTGAAETIATTTLPAAGPAVASVPDQPEVVATGGLPVGGAPVGGALAIALLVVGMIVAIGSLRPARREAAATTTESTR